MEIARTIQNIRTILQQGQLRDALAKYLVMLDNELYKAIKALREAQVWRLDALNGFVLEKVAVLERNLSSLCSLFRYVHY